MRKLKNTYRDALVDSDLDLQTTDFDATMMHVEARRALCREYAWAIPDSRFVNQLKIFVAPRSVLEVGAGGGYWAYFMRQMGVPMVATDLLPYKSKWSNRKWSAVKRLGAVESVKMFPLHTLMMVWPEGNHHPMAAETLKAYRGSHFVYVGEPARITYHGQVVRGSCGNDAFFEMLTDGWDLVFQDTPIYTYQGIHTKHFFYVRQGTLTQEQSDGLRTKMGAV
jgi:hypothetical protein